ncbi:hypothetical protein TrVFT333_000945 [Trichoderma virens FT-333]|nr:hypothetical protein TrVFT333_000945 [Trichoderma virens FT-333]
MSAFTEECYGQMCWLTIPVINIDRAKAFYAEVFSWETNPKAFLTGGPASKSYSFSIVAKH